MRFAAGQTILRRFFRGDRINFLNVCRVLADDEQGLRIWLPIGTPYWRRLTPDGRNGHEAPMAEILATGELAELTWSGSHVLVFLPPRAAHSIWWFFAPDGEFKGWYGNLEAPSARWGVVGGHLGQTSKAAICGVDTEDHELDLWFAPDRSWRWKDEEAFAELIGHPLFWSAEQAAGIRAEGEKLIKLAEAGDFPFDGTWCDLPLPEPGPALVRPDGWDRPRA